METSITIPLRTNEDGSVISPTNEDFEEQLAKAQAKAAFTKERRRKAESLVFESLDNLVRVPYILPAFVRDATERENLRREIHAAEELVRELWHRIQKAR